jgi:hypothetical protein
MKTRHAICISLLSVATLWGASAALAQVPSDAVMLVPGVYTTPEISAKCQKYARDRVGLSGHTDTSRQAVALACVQKLWQQKQVKGTR